VFNQNKIKKMKYAQVHLIYKILIIFHLFTACNSNGVEVTIKNHDTIAIDSLELIVTGNKYYLGSLLSGESKSTNVLVSGESHIEINHSSKQKLLVDVYLEPGYRGNILVDMTADSVLNVVPELRIVPF
jgi:hypothetical protein